MPRGPSAVRVAPWTSSAPSVRTTPEASMTSLGKGRQAERIDPGNARKRHHVTKDEPKMEEGSEQDRHVEELMRGEPTSRQTKGKVLHERAKRIGEAPSNDPE